METADGTEQVIDITINGANDAAVITGTATDSVLEASGVLNGTAGDATASGDLNATDVDSSATFVVQSGVAKTYGTFSIEPRVPGATRSNNDNARFRRSTRRARRCTSWSRWRRLTAPRRSSTSPSTAPTTRR